jgi:hypothetical protein
MAPLDMRLDACWQDLRRSRHNAIRHQFWVFDAVVLAEEVRGDGH